MPYPANDGSSIAISSMVEGFLAQNAEIKLLSINTLKHYKSDQAVEQARPNGLEIHTVKSNTNVTAGGALANLISGKPYHVSRFLTPDFTDKLIQLLSKDSFDVIQIEGLSMAVYLPILRKYSKAKISYRAHNAEYQIWERTRLSESNPLKKWYLGIQVNRLKKFEQKTLSEIDTLVTITDTDLKTLSKIGFNKSLVNIPCGVDLSRYNVRENSNPAFDITYLASFDWPPNQQGLFWFMEKVWPLVLQLRPETTFCIAGRKMPDSIRNISAPSFSNQGEIEDMSAFIQDGKINIVPLLAGSGMRIKIVENMALSRPMVSTTIGAEGIDIKNEEDILLRDQPEAFAKAIVELLNNDDLRDRLSKNAREKAKAKYDSKMLGKTLVEFYTNLI